MNSIARVSLNQINVGYEGIKFMSNSVLFHCMEGVEFLTLAGNSIDSKGFIMIMKSIERGGFPKLEVLDMRDNKIGDDGCNYLLGALTRCQLGVLREINLACIMYLGV